LQKVVDPDHATINQEGCLKCSTRPNNLVEGILNGHQKATLSKTMNTHFELRAVVPDALVDTIDAHLLENELIDWVMLQKDPREPYELFGVFSDADTAQKALSELRAEFPELPERFTEKVVDVVDWQNAYKKFLKPWSDRQLYWVPLWERESYGSPASAVCIYLDSGMAFGTGAHETTRLCASRLLDYHERQTDSLDELQVIDAGCGSGILALSASALGFKNVVGFDMDPQAIEVCQRNTDENPQIPAPEFEIADLEKGLHSKQADLLLANIQTDVLIPFRSQLTRSVKASGTLVLSGILTKEAEQVRMYYATEFDQLHSGETVSIDSRQYGEWSDLQFSLSRA